MIEALSLTQTLAFFIGLYFLSAGIGLWRDRASAVAMLREFQTKPALGYLSGVAVFAIGAAMVGLHNDWSSVLSGFVSLVGWAALLEGVLLLAVRDRFLELVSSFAMSDKFLQAMAIAVVLGGVVLLLCALT